MQWSRVEPLEYFASLVSPQGSVPVFEAAAALAQIPSPEMDVEAVLLEMDLLTRRLRARLPADASSAHRLHLLHHVFFDELSFGGNANDFYSAPNGLVSEVLRTRRGIPASLALIYVEMARSIGLVASGVAFPGHFLVRVRQPSGLAFVDPLTGRSLGRSVLEEWLAPYLEASVLTSRTGSTPMSGPATTALWERLLAPVTDRDLLLHLLRHLEAAYRVADDAVCRGRVLQRLVLLQPSAATRTEGLHPGPGKAAMPDRSAGPVFRGPARPRRSHPPGGVSDWMREADPGRDRGGAGAEETDSQG